MPDTTTPAPPADVRTAAAAMGRIGGRSRSEAKRAAARRNAEARRGVPISDETRERLRQAALRAWAPGGARRKRQEEGTASCEQAPG